jgi:hypothetical protein
MRHMNYIHAKVFNIFLGHPNAQRLLVILVRPIKTSIIHTFDTYSKYYELFIQF